MIGPTHTPNKLGKQGDLRSPARPPAVSKRALLIGASLIPANVLWIVNIEYVRYSDNVSTQALYFNTITLLVVLLGINLLLGRLLPGRNFTRGEMLTVYVMVMVSTGLAGHDQMQILFTTIHYAIARATPENGWTQTILPNLPSHLVPPAGDAVIDLYRGRSSLYMPSHYLAWLRPLGWWSAFVFVVVWVMMCMTSVLRRQWESERLTYPIAEIPLKMTDPKAGIFRNNLFWLAFALAAGVRAWVMLSLLVPAVPGLPINVQYYTLSDSMPLRAAGSIPVSFFPFAIGLCFFLPVQISFSVWFFYILSRIELILSAMFGLMQSNAFPYCAEQSAGAAIGLGVAVLWFARAHLKSVWRHVTGREKLNDSQEPLSYRVAVWGFFIGCAFMVKFAIWAGMRPFTAVIYMFFFIVLVVVVARIRAEVGLPTMELYQVGGDSLMRAFAGDSFWNRRELTVMTLFFWLSRTHRQFPMSSQVDSVRIADRAGISARSITTAILLASGITIIAAFWTMLHVMYQTGYESARMSQTITWAFGADPWTRYHSYIISPRLPDAGRTGGYMFGFVLTLVLSVMRARFPWWPLHPVGYLTSGSFGLSRLWVPLMLAWTAKVTLLRFGGLRTYEKAIPFFIGLVVGEFAMGFLGSILNLCGFYIPPNGGLGGL